MDRKNNEGFSKALWIPFTWLFFNRSRNISEWLNLGTPDIATAATTILEGNPLNRNVYTFLIIAGVLVLLKRKIDWQTIFVKNKWIWLYFVFGALSLFWSDYPYISFKRWIKALGVVIMVLVVVTESRPYIAIGLILKRLAFILIPLSVLFIKYYPEFGRAYHMGNPMYTGVGDTKNSLGALCLISGVYFSWNLIFGRRDANKPVQRLHYSIYLIMIPMIAWLFYMANSATSLACMFFALFLFLLASHPVMVREPRKIIIFAITGAVIFGILELAFDVKEVLFTLLGRGADLTNRVDIWEYLLGMVEHPIIGFGYESFWIGERLNMIQERWGNIIQAHSGYLEMYLNMGIIGVCFIICWIISGLVSVTHHLKNDYPAALLRLCFILVVVLYNYTEATFYGVSGMWILFFIGVSSIPRQMAQRDNHS